MKRFTSLKDIQSLLTKGDILLEVLVSDYIGNIKRSKTNSFIEVFEEEAKAKAKDISDKINLGTKG